MSVNSQILNIIHDIEELNEETTTINESIVTINGDIEDLGKNKQNNITTSDTIQISKLKTQYITMTLTGQDLQTTIGIIDSYASDLSGTVDDLNTYAIDLSGTVDDLNTYAIDLSGIVDDLSGTVGSLNTYAIDLSGTVDDLNTYAIDLSGTVDDLSGTVDDLNTYAIDLSGTVDDLTGTVGSLNTYAIDLSGTVDDLSGTVGSLNTYAIDLSGTVDTKQVKITENIDIEPGNIIADNITLRTPIILYGGGIGVGGSIKASSITTGSLSALLEISTLTSMSAGTTLTVAGVDIGSELIKLEGRIETNESGISSNSGSISGLGTAIATLENSVFGSGIVPFRIPGLVDLVGTNSGSITGLSTALGVANGRIDDNDKDITSLQDNKQDKLNSTVSITFNLIDCSGIDISGVNFKDALEEKIDKTTYNLLDKSFLDLSNNRLYAVEGYVTDISNNRLYEVETNLTDISNNRLSSVEDYVTDISNNRLYEVETNLTDISNNRLYEVETNLTDISNNRLYEVELT